MNKNLVWKFVLIIVLVAFCLLEMVPPSEKLKPGIDLAGGTSLLYQIDTSGLTPHEKRDIAEQMIRILQQRIDPGSQKNLIWRPHGSDRIEIQMPLADQETRRLRNEYYQKRSALEASNLDWRLIEQSLYLTGEDRDKRFAQLAGDSKERLASLQEYGRIYDLERQAQAKRDAALLKEGQQKEQIEQAGINPAGITQLFRDWNNLDDPNRMVRVSELSGADAKKETLIKEYILGRGELSQARNELDELDKQLIQAKLNLNQTNINLDQLEKILSASGTKRQEGISRLKAERPEAAGRLDELVMAFGVYSKVSGRLDDPEDLKRQLRGSGVLEFRILPTISGGELSESEIKNLQDRLKLYGPKLGGTENYLWMAIKNPRDFRGGVIRGEVSEQEYVLASNNPDECMLRETGENAWRLVNARLDTDDYGGWAVAFGFNEIGADHFLRLTKKNIERPLCILLDGEAISAPSIRSAIRDRGQITGNFSQQEATDLVDKLNAGSLPARLGDQPISEYTVGPTLGHDNLMAGYTAAKYGFIAVTGFMVLYYLLSGALADLALVMNLLLILGVMGFSRATFTMPGIAGLILMIGMAVDANVLIFERIREEQKRGASLRMAIKNGYDRALRTILDANATTFIVALILYMRASEEVKGFALTLMIGLISNMFTAVFVTRCVFDLLTSRRIINQKLYMMQLIKVAKIGWMRMRPGFWTISLALVVGGWFFTVVRHASPSSMYSIEFTGGTSIHVVLTQTGANEMLSEQEKARHLTLREKVEQAIQAIGREMKNPGIEAARVQRIGPEDSREYEIVTTAANKSEVVVSLAGPTTMTAPQVQDKIRQAGKSMGDRRMEGSVVTALDTPEKFMLVTGQTNPTQINEAINQALTGAVVSSIEVKEIVSDAVRKALAGKLDIQDDLLPRDITAAPITEDMVRNRLELSDFVGGIFLSCDFGEGNSETFGRLQDRFERIKLRSSFAKYGINKFRLFPPGGETVAKDQPLKAISIAVVSPDMVYGRSTPEEWQAFDAEQKNWFKDALSLETSFGSVTQIDPSVGREGMNAAMVAIVISLLAIIAYIWIRFGNWQFGTAAVIALVHDVSIALGMVAASAWLASTAVGKALLIGDFRIDPPMIAGFLTVIGYSLNDTIVVFDRIRENRGKLAVLSREVVDNSINQTLSRTILTGFTTLMVLVIMYIWGGEGLRGFNYVLIIGIVVGTYSSIAIASPLLIGAKAHAAKKLPSTNKND